MTDDRMETVWATVRNDRDLLKKEIMALKGALAAQDERERRAAERMGMDWFEHGCDWPDAAADNMQALQADLAEARSILDALMGYYWAADMLYDTDFARAKDWMERNRKVK